MNETLISQLVKLNETGLDGFEGLIAKLLARLLGRIFYLARSGSQAGRDMSSDHLSQSIIAVECKRYRKSTEFDETELQGKLVQVNRSIPGLDIWALASSRAIPSQLEMSLRQQAEEAGISFVPIASGLDEIGTLDVLCASNIEAVIEAIHLQDAPESIEMVRQELHAIADSPEFNRLVEQLRDSFSPSHVGYPNWSVAQKHWLRRCLSSEKESRAHLGQVLNVAEAGVQVIPRQAAWTRLDSWLAQWSDDPQDLVVTGEEGDGKTWAVASWLNDRLTHHDAFPPVLFLPSEGVSSTDPHTLISEAIGSILGRYPEGLWSRRLEQWKQRPETNSPLMLLVLDGINERHEPQWWRKLLENLATEPWRMRVAVIITSRARYWNEYFGKLRHLAYLTFELPPFSDRELGLALRQFGLSASDFEHELLPLLRKPRYLDRVIKHRKSIQESGDFTPARLVYEDWRDRTERKRGLGLSDDDFQAVLRDLARQRREGMPSVSRGEIAELLELHPKKDDIFRELETSGVFRRHSGRYRVDDMLLAHGLGLLLADEALDATQNPMIDVRETIERWLEPHAEMDLKSRICEVAALHSLESSDYPTNIQAILLHWWLTSKNPGAEVESAFRAYFPLGCQAYFTLAEMVCSEPHDSPWAQDLMMATLLRWGNTKELQPAFVRTFDRWLGFVHASPYPLLGPPNDAQIEETRRAIRERLGRDLVPGPLEFYGYNLTIIEDEGLLRLGRLALGVISSGTLEPFVHAIATGCVAFTIMGFHSDWDIVAWTIRSAREPLWSIFEAEIKTLSSASNIVTKQAAHRLLTFIGSQAALDLKRMLPDKLFPIGQLAAEVKDDPCHMLREWTREGLELCLQKQDIPPVWIARKLQPLCIDPSLAIPDGVISKLGQIPPNIRVENLWLGLFGTEEEHILREVEPALAALAPDILANVICRAIGQIDKREQMPLRQMAVRLPEYSLILGDDQWESIRSVWTSLWSRFEKLDQTDKETLIFMAPAVLAQLDSKEQLSFIVNRPVDAPDYLRYEPTFQLLSNWEDVQAKLVDANSANDLTRVLWFISASAFAIPDNIFDQIIYLSHHENTMVRAYALKIIYDSGKRDAAMEVVHGIWSWNPQNTLEENTWGSLILCEHGHELPYYDLRARINPNHLGYAVAKRGLLPNEIDRYVEDTHSLWLILAAKTPELPLDLPAASLETDLSLSKPSTVERVGLLHESVSQGFKYSTRSSSWGRQEQSQPSDLFTFSIEDVDKQNQEWLDLIRRSIDQQTKSGNLWFAQRFSPDSLDAVVLTRPDLVTEWLGGSDTQMNIPQSLLVKGRAFYEALCSVLLRVDPGKGVQLYQMLQGVELGVRFLREGTQIPLLDYTLFGTAAAEPVVKAWERRLDQCRTDRELLEVVLVALQGNGTQWLWQKIEAAVKSEVLYERARAYVLLRFFESPEAGNLLQELAETLLETWLGDLARRCQHHWQTNEWAKHWFHRFLETEDKVLAWASFRLFLRCVDSRFWHWWPDMTNGSSDIPWASERQVYLQNNLNEIENCVRRNEKTIREQFLGQKRLEHHAWPWI